MGALAPVTIIIVASLGMLYQAILAPLLLAGGIFRNVQPLNNQNCQIVPQLEGCEKIVLPPGSSSVYLACSQIAGRKHWLPSVLHLNPRGMPTDDHVSTYSLDTGKITRLSLVDFDSSRGLSVHGMDVVPSASDSQKMFIYLVNHRAPLTGNAQEVGADSCIEIFETRVGSDILKHLHTVEDSIILTPNDIVGNPDGRSFWFTNDHSAKTGLQRYVEGFLRLSRTSVGYCHIDRGCKIAANHLPSANGIARSETNDTFYVSGARGGGIQILEKQADNKLALTEVIAAPEYAFDNLSIDRAGALWAASFPKGLDLLKRTKNLSISAASGAVRITSNVGQGASSGKKYKIEKVFEDDGRVIQGATSVIHIPEKNLLILSGISSPQTALCRV